MAVTGPATPPPATRVRGIVPSSIYFVWSNEIYGRVAAMATPLGERRRELLASLETAGRASSAATVMFHSTVAALQGLSATEEKALDLLQRDGPLSAGELAKRAGL